MVCMRVDGLLHLYGDGVGTGCFRNPGTSGCAGGLAINCCRNDSFPSRLVALVSALLKHPARGFLKLMGHEMRWSNCWKRRSCLC